MNDDLFQSNAPPSSWNPSDDNVTWSRVDAGTGTFYLGESGTEEMCPICILLLDGLEGKEAEQGQALFAKYMHIRLHFASDGQSNVTTTQGWYCAMCSAEGEGKVPEFHAKPRKEATP